MWFFYLWPIFELVLSFFDSDFTYHISVIRARLGDISWSILRGRRRCFKIITNLLAWRGPPRISNPIFACLVLVRRGRCGSSPFSGLGSLIGLSGGFSCCSGFWRLKKMFRYFDIKIFELSFIFTKINRTKIGKSASIIREIKKKTQKTCQMLTNPMKIKIFWPWTTFWVQELILEKIGD